MTTALRTMTIRNAASIGMTAALLAGCASSRDGASCSGATVFGPMTAAGAPAGAAYVAARNARRACEKDARDRAAADPRRD